MKMDRRRLVSEVVVQIDNHSVADCSLDSWDRPLPIDANNGSLEEPVRVCPHPLGGKVVDAGGSLSKRAEGEGKTNKKI